MGFFCIFVPMEENKQKILYDKFLWLQAIHLMEDTLPTDNPATGRKTIDALYGKFEIKLRDDKTL
jgi:hypothetical protein